jgi:serine protease Do
MTFDDTSHSAGHGRRAAIAVLVMLAAGAAAAQEEFALAARRVLPSVVSLFTEKLKTGRVQGAVRQYSARGEGSGFVIDTLGDILTCNHVIADYQSIEVKLPDGRVIGEPRVRVIGRDPATDLAVVRVEGVSGLKPVEWGNSDALEPGQAVLATGSPFGLEGSISAGVVSGLSRWGLPKSSGPDFQDFIQTDALINPGNSGGPLVDAQGRVVGVNSFIRTNQGGNTGIGFATPGNLARDVARALVADGTVRRGFIGINTQALTGPIRAALGYAGQGGVLVVTTTYEGPGAKAGLKPGDVLVELDGAPVTDVRWFQNAVASREPGSAVRLGFVRLGRRAETQATLASWPVSSTDPKPRIESKFWLGMRVRDLGSADRSRTGLTAGAVVDQLEADAAAGGAGLQTGDVIVEVNLAPVRSRADFVRIQKTMTGINRPLLVRAYRGRSAFYTAVEP